MNNDARIRNRMLDIYSDLARYTHMNQMQTNDTLQQIESGIRELNTYDGEMYHGNTNRYTNRYTNNNRWEERIPRNPPESTPLFTTDRTAPIVRNFFNPRQPVNNRPTSVNYMTPTNTRRVNPNNVRPVASNNVTDNGATINQLSNTEFFNQFFNMFNTDLNNLTPVTVRPTQTQIINATEIISINENMVNTICPILQTTFQDGDRISRIKQCGHCFIEEGLMVWFNQSVRCPVCRYDIRDYPIEPTPVVPVEPIQRVVPVVPRNTRDLSNNILNSTSDRENTTSTNNDNNLMDIFTNQISNTFQQYLTGSDSSFNNLNNGSISVDYFVQTPTSIYTTSTPSRLFTNNNFETRNNETVEEDEEDEEHEEHEEEEHEEDVLLSDEELCEDEYIDE